jgi:hypothetical protein
LFDLAQLHTNVGSYGLRRRNQDNADHRCPEARVFCFDRVCAVHDVGYGIVAGSAGRYGLTYLRVRIGDSDGNCWQNSARWVSYRPDDNAKRLRKRNASTTQREHQNKNSRTPSFTRGSSHLVSFGRIPRLGVEREIMIQGVGIFEPNIRDSQERLADVS